MSSKFKGILDQAKGRDTEPAEAPPAPAPAPVKLRTPRPPADAASPTTDASPPPAPPADAAPRRGPGRPKGKRTDPGFAQVSAYIPADLHHGIKLALLQERKGREFSELVAELLAGWLAGRPRD